MEKKFKFIIAIIVGILVFSLTLSDCVFATIPAQEQYNSIIVPEEKNFYNNDIKFNNLQEKFIEAIDNLNDNYCSDIDPKNPYYKNNWVKIIETEGSYYYALNFKYIAKKYQKTISNEYYLWLMFLDKTSGSVSDGGLITETDNIRKYLIFMENFTKNYPNFVRIDDVKMLELQYRYIYLFGLDNTPIFDQYDTKKMNLDYKKSYETFLSKNKDSKYYPMVSEFYNKAKENNFMWSKTFDDWHLKTFQDKYFSE